MDASEAEDAVPDLPSASDSAPPSRKPSHSVSDRPPQLPPLNVHVSPNRHRRASSTGSLSPPRPAYDRSDSVTWSDRDWLDSQDESDVDNDFLAYGHRRSKSQEDGAKKKSGSGKEIKRTGSPVWNWTEKIVGRGSHKKGGSSSKSGGGGPLSPAASEPPTSPVDGSSSTGRVGLLR